MKLHQILYILEIAKAKSINQAAKNLYISQPHLSATVAELEKSLNITIFQRTNKGVVLTAVGEEFVKCSQYIIEQMDYMENLHSFHEYREQMTLAIASNCHNSLANEILLKLQVLHSGKTTRFALQTQNTLAIIQSISKHQLNLGLLVIPALEIASLEGLLHTKKLAFHQLHEESAFALVGQQSPLYHLQQTSLDDCRKYPLVRFDDDWERTFNAYHLHDFQHIITVSDKEAFFQTISDSQYLALGSKTINTASHYITQDLIRFIPIDQNSYNHYLIGWIQRKNSPLTTLENQFIEIYQGYFQPLRPS